MSRRHGVTDHEMLYCFETANQRFRRLGMPEHVANRLALYMTFRMSGAFNELQAWEATNEIFPFSEEPEEANV